MKITKYYKFYYGHRNQELNDKCNRLHGHIAQIYITFNVKREGSISTLFNDFDSKLEPYFKNEFDHRTMIDINDPLLPYLISFEMEQGKSLGYKVLPFATSVENMCFYLFHQITQMGFDIFELKFQETQSSTVSYDLADYLADLNSSLGQILNEFKISFTCF